MGEIYWVSLSELRIATHQFPIIAPLGAITVVENVLVAVTALLQIVVDFVFPQERFMKAVPIRLMVIIVKVTIVEFRSSIVCVVVVV